MDEIVAQAKANKRMVYHYFGSKNELYIAVLMDVFSRLESVEFRAVVGSGHPDEQLRELLAAYFEFLDANPEFVRLLLWENLERGRNITRAASKLTKNPFMERFRAVIDQGVEEGIFRAPVDTKHLLVNFIGLCFIYYSNHYSLAASVKLDLDSPVNQRLRLAQAVDLVFNGLLAD